MKNNIGYLFSITLKVMEIKSEVGITNLVFILYTSKFALPYF